MRFVCVIGTGLATIEAAAGADEHGNVLRGCVEQASAAEDYPTHHRHYCFQYPDRLSSFRTRRQVA